MTSQLSGFLRWNHQREKESERINGGHTSLLSIFRPGYAYLFLPLFLDGSVVFLCNWDPDKVGKHRWESNRTRKRMNSWQAWMKKEEGLWAAAFQFLISASLSFPVGEVSYDNHFTLNLSQFWNNFINDKTNLVVSIVLGFCCGMKSPSLASI